MNPGRHETIEMILNTSLVKVDQQLSEEYRNDIVSSQLFGLSRFSIFELANLTKLFNGLEKIVFSTLFLFTFLLLDKLVENDAELGLEGFCSDFDRLGTGLLL